MAEYKLHGHTTFQGLNIAVENRKGSVRSGTDKDGKPWRTVMKVPYGYIKGTKGHDGEELDVFVGPKEDAPHAFVVHQRKDDGKTFDEHKAILGVSSKSEAKKLYLAHYNSKKFLGPIQKMPVAALKELVGSGRMLEKISGLAFVDELAKIQGSCVG